MDGIAIFMLKIHKIATNIPKKITAQILIVARVYLALVNIAYKIWIDKQVALSRESNCTMPICLFFIF